MNRFNGILLLVKGGSKSFDEVKSDINAIKMDFKSISSAIDSINPPLGMVEVHQTVSKAGNYYYDALTDFMEFYVDGNDDHFISSGLLINEANQLLHHGAYLLNES